MEQRLLGRTGLRVSVLGLGCQSLGGGIDGRDDRAALRTLLEARDAGVTFFDVADTYGSGNSELLLGKAFGGSARRGVILATKAGYVPTTLGRVGRLGGWVRPVRGLLRGLRPWINSIRHDFWYRDFSPGHLARAVEGSLRRLRTDYLDLFQLHDPQPAVLEAADTFEALERMKAAGKIRHYGVSCAKTPDAPPCLQSPQVETVQLTVNLLAQEACGGILPQAEAAGHRVIARMPLAQGLLTGGTGDTKAQRLSAHPDKTARRREQGRAFTFLVRPDRTLAQSAIRFVLQQPGVAVTIPGVSSPAHLAEALGALTAPALTAEELEKARGLST